jgi:serine protease AprX
MQVYTRHLLALLPLFLAFNTLSAQVISPALERTLRTQEKAEFLLLMKAQADVSFARQLPTKLERGRYVYEQTRQLAEKTQAPVQAILEEHGAAYRSFYIVNALWVSGDLALARELAGLPEVAQLQRNPRFQLDVLPGKEAQLSTRSAGVEWGIEKIGAEAVWAMGYTGQEVVIGGQDTGYDWDHPAIVDTYRGWDGSTASHDYNWHDAIHQIDSLNGAPYEPEANPCGLDSPVPCDDNNHGTHTMGTMAGSESDEGKKIGVAPDAQWIGCRNMERGWGSPASYIECFEWFLAPTNISGEAPDPSKAPHVINNSWACPAIEGCTPENFALMREIVDNLKAAGIVVVVSAGNSGPDCGTVRTPAAVFENSFTVGATQPSDTIAGFSSRGTVAIDSSDRLKPDIAAPGVGIRSSIKDGGFATFSGTSMAGPHIAGAVALLISANPALSGQVELIEDIIERTAKPMLSVQNCDSRPGTLVPNPVYGYGRIDIAAAVQEALGLTTTVAPQASAQLQLIPNPTSGQITLQRLAAPDNTAGFKLLDSRGRIVYQQPWPQGQVQISLDLGSLPSGMYFYQLSDGRELQRGKILKQ